MQIHLPALPVDLTDREDRIRDLLTDAQDPDENVQNACGNLDRILSYVFNSLEKGDPRRGWCVDDLWCVAVKCAGSKVTLQGPSYWLVGGLNCEWFQVDVALDKDPLLYSYKFTSGQYSKIGTKTRPVLYIGKHPKGWTVNGAQRDDAADRGFVRPAARGRKRRRKQD